MDLIISKADHVSRREAIAAMRLVSHSWNAAIREHPGILTNISVRDPADLTTLHKIMPDMRGLEMTLPVIKVDLHRLAHLTSMSYLKLTQRSISASDTEPECVDLSMLPTCLRKLHLDRMYAFPETLELLRCTDLIALHFSIHWNSSDDIWELLRCLPKLEVNAFRSSAYSAYEPVIHRDHFGELQRLYEF